MKIRTKQWAAEFKHPSTKQESMMNYKPSQKMWLNKGKSGNPGGKSNG